MHKERMQVKKKKREKERRSMHRSLLIYTLSSSVRHSISQLVLLLLSWPHVPFPSWFAPLSRTTLPCGDRRGVRGPAASASVKERKTDILSLIPPVVNPYGTYCSKPNAFCSQGKKGIRKIGGKKTRSNKMQRQTSPKPSQLSRQTTSSLRLPHAKTNCYGQRKERGPLEHPPRELFMTLGSSTHNEVVLKKQNETIKEDQVKTMECPVFLLRHLI